MIDDLTDAEKRVLVFMGEYGPKWFTLQELEQIRLLEKDDFLTVPSLIERKLMWHLYAMGAVALTPAGHTIADELRTNR